MGVAASATRITRLGKPGQHNLSGVALEQGPEMTALKGGLVAERFPQP